MCAEAAEGGITLEDNSYAESGADVNRDSLSENLDADSVASSIDGRGLSDILFVKTNVDCKNGGLLEGGDILLEAISAEETSFKK